MRPEEIEVLSFQIIDREAGAHDFSLEQWAVVRRMIHTSADFEYMKTVRFHPDAI
ncbi:MAG TPA: precorrin-8X methylmutase, partial [Desulfobacteraceae bacterium]|nr:precorrin-8X methylmutase [Desulfobacteraceae bacterium]